MKKLIIHNPTFIEKTYEESPKISRFNTRIVKKNFMKRNNFQEEFLKNNFIGKIFYKINRKKKY